MTDLKEMVNLTIGTVDVDGDRILITTKCGREFLFQHDQCCCENVRIYNNIGDLQVLENQKLVHVDLIEYEKHPEDVDVEKEFPYLDSWIWTDITFKTDKDTVISRWIGESNGYYSERVDFYEITK